MLTSGFIFNIAPSIRSLATVFIGSECVKQIFPQGVDGTWRNIEKENIII